MAPAPTTVISRAMTPRGGSLVSMGSPLAALGEHRSHRRLLMRRFIQCMAGEGVLLQVEHAAPSTLRDLSCNSITSLKAERSSE